MAKDHKALVERVYDAIERGATTEIRDLFSDDFVEHDELPGSSATGRALVEEWTRMMKSAFPDLRFRIESIMSSGDDVAVRARMTGTHKGEFMGMPATGRKVDVLCVDWAKLNRSGKFTEHWGFLQESELMQQLGAPRTIDLTDGERADAARSKSGRSTTRSTSR